jgi:hypothetical protein
VFHNLPRLASVRNRTPGADFSYVVNLFCLGVILPATVAARSKACTVFARSEAGIMGSNPTQGMDV